LLVIAKKNYGATGIVAMRQTLCQNSTDISFASKLWQVFRAKISGALEKLKSIQGDALTMVLETIEAHVQSFFVQALPFTPRLCGLRPYKSKDLRNFRS
jgi:hypothetical protein